MADGSERGGLAVEKDYRSAFKSRDFRLYQTARLNGDSGGGGAVGRGGVAGYMR